VGLTLADLLTPEAVSTIRARIVAGLVADGYPWPSWAPSAAGGVENMRLDMAAGGVGIYMSPRIAAMVAGRLLPLAADDDSGPWLSMLGAKFYGLTKRPATKTVRNIALYSIGTGGSYTFSPGDLWVRFEGTGNRYVNITGGSFSSANTGPPGPGFPGNPLMLEFEAENPGSSYADGTGPVTMVTARAGVRALSMAPSDYLPASINGPSSGTVVATIVSGGPAPPKSIRLAIQSSGNVGGATFTVSVDGGATFSSAYPVVPTFAIAGAQLAFANSLVTPSFIAGDTYTLLLGDAILSRGNDAESDDLFRRRCANRWPSLSPVPVAATVELWAQEASPEVTRVSADADPNTSGAMVVTIASARGPASAAAQIAVEDYINDRLLGYKGVPPPTTNGFPSPAETARVVSAQTCFIIAKGVVRVPKAKLAQAQVDANNAWNAYLASVPVGGQPGAVVELARFAQILADAGGIDVPGAISQLTLNGFSGDIPVPPGQVSVPPDNATLTQLVIWVPA
jgi:hypothetical protein